MWGNRLSLVTSCSSILCPLHPSPPPLPHPTLYLQEFTNVLGSGDQKTQCCPFLGMFCFENQLWHSSQWVIKMLPVQCNAMRLVSKEENLKRQNYPKLHLTLPNSVQHPTSHQATPPPYLPPPPTLPLTVSKLQDRKGNSILSITKENRKFRYFHFLISGGS